MILFYLFFLTEYCKIPLSVALSGIPNLIEKYFNLFNSSGINISSVDKGGTSNEILCCCK